MKMSLGFTGPDSPSEKEEDTASNWTFDMKKGGGVGKNVEDRQGPDRHRAGKRKQDPGKGLRTKNNSEKKRAGQKRVPGTNPGDGR